jgi:hypothetical protein
MAGQQPVLRPQGIPYEEWNRPVDRIYYGWGDWAYNNPQEFRSAPPPPRTPPRPETPPTPEEWKGYAKYKWHPGLKKHVKALKRFDYMPNAADYLQLRPGQVFGTRRRSRSRSRSRGRSRGRRRGMRIFDERTRRYRTVSPSRSRSRERSRSRRRSGSRGRGGR